MNQTKESELSGYPKICVIICTHNREAVIVDCCKSVLMQSIPMDIYEVIVVDNASTDQTATVLSELSNGSDFQNFQILYEPRVGLSHARNLGVRSAHADYVAFIDDEARAPADWLKTALHIVETQNPDIFGGPAFPIFPNGKPAWFKDEYAIRGDMGNTGVLKEGGFLIGTNIFFRKALIDEYGGFNPDLGMKGSNIAYHEETSLVTRARVQGKKIFYSKELVVEDMIPDYKLSLAFIIYSKYKAGKDIWKFQEEENVQSNLKDFLAFIDETFGMFNTALLTRDIERYPFPENYIYENVTHQFYYIGKMIEYFRNKT